MTITAAPNNTLLSLWRHLMSLYICYAHYVHSARGWRLFDQKKTLVVGGCLNVGGGCFCWLFFHFLLFFVIFLLFVIFVNYFLLLKGARCVVLIYFLIVQGEGVRLHICPSQISFIVEGEGVCFHFFIKFFFYCWGGGGWRLMFFFSLIWLMEGGKRGGEG